MDILHNEESIRRNADADHLVEALEEAFEQADKGRLAVYETEAKMVAITDEAMKNRNLNDYSDYLFTIEWQNMEVSGRKWGTHLVLKFHERLVENTFELNPAGPHAIDAQQATQPWELGKALRRTISGVDDHFDVHKWDFSEVNGASIANSGHVCDYEWEYYTFI